MRYKKHQMIIPNIMRI